MNQHIYRSSLYNFLKFALDNPSEKKVLDCGAGGPKPPLALFHCHGFETYGIEISDDQIESAKEYCDQNNLDLNIQFGDMRDIQFPEETFGFVYSIYSSIHLSKEDTGKAVKEMERVLKKGGLCYINFLSTDDFFYGEGKEINPGEFLTQDGDEEYLHSYYTDDEPDRYFTETKILYKEKRNILMRTDVPQYRSCTLDYIVIKI